MRRCIFPLLAMIALTTASPARAQQLSDLLQRQLPVQGERKPSATELLQIGFVQEKAHGNIDSAAAVYKEVVRLYESGEANERTVAVARRRLWHISKNSGGGLADVSRPNPLPGRLTLLTLGGRLKVQDRKTMASSSGWVEVGVPPGWLHWLSVSTILERTRRQPGSRATVRLEALGHAIGAVRVALGIRGLSEYVAEVARRKAPRPLTVQERLLAALIEEKENRDFDSACGHYRELVQLSSTGGIATHLINRARQLLGRCQRWQQQRAAGS